MSRQQLDYETIVNQHIRRIEDATTAVLHVYDPDESAGDVCEELAGYAVERYRQGRPITIECLVADYGLALKGGQQ